MIPPFCLIFALFFFTAGLPAIAAPTDSANATQEPPLTGKQILQKTAQSLRHSNFQGTVVFLRNGKLEPMQYIHAFNDGLEQERLLSLNSPLREMVREAGKVSCFYQKSHYQRVEHPPFNRSFLVDLPADIGILETAYAIELAGEENIALVPTYVIHLNPIDKFRYPRTFWVEKRHFLPLQAIVSPLDGTAIESDPLEQMVFTDFSVKDHIPFVDIQPTQPPDPFNQITPLPITAANFAVERLPLGFSKLFFNRRLMHNEARPVDQMVLSDGLAWVSIYMEYKKTGLAHTETAENISIPPVGAIHFYSRTLGDFEFTVMGDVPPKTVKQIAENIQLRNRQ